MRGWLDTIAADISTATTIRSAALFPRAAARFEAAGFEVADRLVLLRADLDDARVRAAVGGRGDRATRTMRRHHFGAAAAIDRAAFGAAGATTPPSSPRSAAPRRLTPPATASTRHAGSASPGRGELVAFAIAGASSEHGYLQRLAVDPGAQRRATGGR